MLVSVFILTKQEVLLYFTRHFVERKLVFKIVQVIELVDLTFQVPKTFANA